ncbi:receptor-like protein 7 [Arachis stenosperma]|uniref:receptor-like protein 7 n=1 Tax=Arachis stenosperma TaxID=217475 RepID=UPI0025AD109D|nr:receptor-like protein 7 [Arachis stenosperma]
MMRCFTLLLLFLLLVDTPSSTCSSVLPLCNHHDNSNLLQLKNSFAIKPSLWYDDYWFFSSYPKIASWKNGTDCCEWDGVTCDTTSGHVIGLDLSCSMLEGEFHPNSTLFHLTHLQQLNLAFNDFSESPIYPGIGNLVSLTHLNLSFSSFSSHIPSTISHLSKLLSLDLSYNELRLDESTWSKLIGNTTNLEELVLDDGVNMSSIRDTSLSLLMNLSSSLLILSLDDTGLHGKFPTRILGLTNLEELSLNDNEELKGELPKSNWSTPLRILDLSWTAFSEEIPDSISHLKSLNKLRLYQCRFHGLIPVSLWNLTQLTHLDLSGNRLLHGEIPSLLSNLKHLTYLALSRNAFSGQIPDLFDNFTKLDYLDLSSNSLEGQVPPSLFCLTQISFLDLSYNKLGGQLPSSLFDLTQLSYLSLSYNQLIGPIPSKNVTLSKLEELHLSNNFINGTIPDWCYSLSSLTVLDLSMNQLTGLISKFSTYSMTCLSLSNNKFQGDFPNSIFEFLKNLKYLDMSSNDFSGLVNFSHFSKLENLNSLDLSNNKFLSIDHNSSVDYVLPKLESLYFSSCSVTVFPSFLARLQNLRSLDLSNNKIHGKIPNWFGDNLLHTWKSMDFIDLSFNQLQGDLPIPPNGTYYFSVSNNNFTGGIPSTLSLSRQLILSHNHLSGTIPSMFCNGTFLYALILSHNHLSGVIPQCLGAVPDLMILDLQVNNLHGNIPTNFSQDNNFQTIKLNNNQLDGSLPRSLSNCTWLEVLDLAENNIEDVFPSWLEGLQELQVLSLRANKFHGTITSFGAKHPFPKLRIFDVSNNKFSGPLPTSFFENFQGMKDLSNSTHHPRGLSYMRSSLSFTGRLYNDSVVVSIKGQFIELVRILTTFTTIDLSNNMFEGEIPHVIGELSSLKGLNLSHNKISGMIPITLGNLTSLEWLDLSWNQLKGEIPMALTNLTFLAVLNLSENQLKGMIPTGEQFNTFQNDSYRGNPMLCGFPLSKSCDNDKEQPPSVFAEAKESLFGWKAVAVGYGCGVVFGMFLGRLFIKTAKPLWLARLLCGYT